MTRSLWTWHGLGLGIREGRLWGRCLEERLLLPSSAVRVLQAEGQSLAPWPCQATSFSHGRDFISLTRSFELF